MPEETAAASSSGRNEEKPCSSTAAHSSVDVMEEAKKLIGTGKRHLVMGDVVSAVNVFQDACGMLAERYGDTAEECGEAFFLCGKSLLELARMENTVLGNALEGVPEESSEEGEKQDNPKFESAENLDEKTRDDLRMQVYDAMAEKDVRGAETKSEPVEVKGEPQNKEEATAESTAQTLEESEAPVKEGEKSLPPGEVVVVVVKEGGVNRSTEQEETGENGSAERKENGRSHEPDAEEEEEKMEEEGEEGGDDDDEDDDDDDEGNADGKGEEEEEVGNLQLAWEMLEVAKVIFKRKESEEDQLMAAQAYLKLGEVSAESGNYPQALEDFQDCLTLQLKHLPPHNRLLAETHYQLGMTLCYTGHYNQAIQHYSSSIKVIESRLAMLQEAIDKAEGGDAAKDEKSELEELKQLLPDIAEKVEDAKESQRTASSASQAIQQTLGGASTSSAFQGENGGPSSSSSSSSSAFAPSQISVRPSEGASSSGSVSDISHLVRKKRKPEEESPKKDTDAKKAKQETTVNGSGDSAHNGKGVLEKETKEASDRRHLFSVGQGPAQGDGRHGRPASPSASVQSTV